MHKAKYCIITCIDFRFQSSYAEFIKSRGMLGECDIISLAGCSRDLVKPLEDWHKSSLLRQIEMSVKLHDPENILLLDHQDCGGYAQDGTITTVMPIEEGIHEHIAWGKLAKNILNDKYPYLTIEMFYFQLDGKVLEN